MSTFHVYSNAKGDYEAIPEDFSIGALLLGGVWALAKRLFKVGSALVAVDALAVYAMRTGQQTGAATWVIIGLVAMLAGRAFIALRAAELREDSMPRRGFQFVATVSAMDADTAISRAVREELSESERGPDATGSMPRVAAAPSAFVQDRPGTRSEFDIDALRSGGTGESPAASGPEGVSTEADAETPSRPRWEPGAARAGRDDRADLGADDDGDADPEERSRRLRLAAIGAVALAIVAGAGYAGWYFLVRTPTVWGGDDLDEQAAAESQANASPEAVPDQATNPGSAPPAPVAASAAVPVAVDAAIPPLAAGATAAAGTGASASATLGATATTATPDVPPPPKPRPVSPAEIEAAWSRHYKPAPKCVEPADWDTYVECINTMMRQHDAFVTKYSQQSAEADAQAGKRP